jgi:hypothetical protein
MPQPTSGANRRRADDFGDERRTASRMPPAARALRRGGTTGTNPADAAPRTRKPSLLETLRMRYPVTPDGRYFVVRGRLWRCTAPGLEQDERERLTRELMQARAVVGRAKRAGDEEGVRRARTAVNRAKIALGERGAVWWTDGAPDYNRHMARNTPYREWFASLPDG